MATMSRPARALVRAEVDYGVAELVGDPDRPQGWTLLVNGTAQSHVDLDDPTHLEFEYVRRMAHVVDLVAPPLTPLHVLHLGGGAWTLARYVAATRPGSAQTVVELDAALAELVAHRPPADGMGIDIRVGDARASLVTHAPASVDLLVLDAFAGARTPAHLTSVEFAELAVRALTPGVYGQRRRRRVGAGLSRAPRWPRPAHSSRTSRRGRRPSHGRRSRQRRAGGVGGGAAGGCASSGAPRPTCSPARVLTGTDLGRFTAALENRPDGRPVADAPAGLLGTLGPS
jgi:hypothetical protein